MDLNGVLGFVPAKYLGYATAAITACAALVAVLPPPKNMRTGYAYVWQMLDFVALNFGHGKTAAKVAAKNEVVPPAAPEHRA